MVLLSMAIQYKARKRRSQYMTELGFFLVLLPKFNEGDAVVMSDDKESNVEKHLMR